MDDKQKNNDEDITIDFSKFKNFFKRKSEKDKVEMVERKAEKVEEKVSAELSKDSANGTLREDKAKIKEIKKELSKDEKEATIIDAEAKLIDNRIAREEKELKKIEKDVPEKEDEDVSFDFSKVKSWFKGGAKKKEQGNEDDVVSFDGAKLWEFTKKYHIVFLLLIPIILSIYLKASAYSLSITDDWAESTLINMNKNILSYQVRAQYPNLPVQNINSIVDTELNKLIANNEIYISTQEGLQKVPFKDAIKDYSNYFKSDFQRDNGVVYPGDIDPYYWMLHARNILKNGHPGDELRNTKTGEVCTQRSAECVPWDNHMIAPLGRAVPSDMFHAYFIAYLNKFISIFNSKQDLLGTILLIPILLPALCVIPAFFIARRISGNFGGFMAAIFVVVHPAFLSRTANSGDTDAYNVLFPLFITWLFLEAFETKSWKKATVLSAISGVLIAFYSFAWGGWWYIFDFIIASVIIYLIVYTIINRDTINTLQRKKEVGHNLLVLGIFFMTALIFTTIVVDYSTFTNAFKGPFAFNALKEVGVDSVWPNVYTTVAELNPSSLDNIITQLGSNSLLFFFLALMGIIFALGKKENLKRNDIYYLVLAAAWYIIVLIIKPQNLIVFLSLIALPIAIRIFLEMYNKKTDIDYKLAIMLVIWFMATIYASTKGVRFTLLLVPAFSISIGIAFGYCYKYLANFLNLNLYLNKKLSKALVALALLLLLLPTVILANGIVKQSVPLINDAWYNSLDAINMQSNPDAIINSWWDYGHWFKYVGGRAVTFDGTSQATPMAHWIGHSLLTNNENDSTGILKMLDCGSNLAFEKLDESINDIAKSVYIIHDIVKTDRKNAKNYLLRYVDDAKAEEVLKYTHCTPPENYFITSDDMIGKSGVWGHFGIWDFNRALIYNTLKRNDYENNKDKSVQFITSRFNYSKEEAEKIYFEVRSVRTSEEANSWIAPWPSYASNVGSCNSDGQDILCPISMQSVKGNLNLRVNLGNKTAYIDTPNGKYYPNSLVYPTKDKIEKLTYTNNTIGYSVTLIPEEGGWRYILMIPPLEDSIFTQLYFLDGHGLSKFKKVTEHRSITGNRIVVWKVDWNGTQKNILPYFSERNSTIPNAPINT